MELHELQTMWNEYDKKLDNSLKLNRQLFRELKLDKAKSKLRSLMHVKIAELLVQLIMGGFLIRYMVQNTGKLPFIVTAFVLLGFVVVGMVLSLKQLFILEQIKRGYSGAIAPLQKKLERLKILLVQYVKWSYLPIPLSPLFTVLGAEIWFNYNFFATKSGDFWWWCFGVGLLLLSFVAWLNHQLSQATIKPFWVKNFLNGSGWSQINAANAFLKEIEHFEKED
ncbi:hypothetical protein [Larkinella rosea]|uniref:Uncharacterized protein n=1 Tax=Larkinella rosea TaxID=2025312 RepID=A0A3P1BPG9_9BACT|nr:hypothetical protein [Larkinella rosea]RRB02736.1 hypothetical protein EHT25_20030 [Larkinella rosea]